jgi:hypothetical protein
MFSKYNFIDRRNLLIEPERRALFVLKFILTTGVISILTELIHNRLTSATTQETFLLFPAVITGEDVLLYCISGLLLGTCQWLILRQYIPKLNFTWINTWALFLTSIGICNAAMSWFFRSEVSKTFPLPLITIITIIGAISIILGLGYFQYLALRTHVAKARWWIVTPFIALVYIALVTFAIQFISPIPDDSLFLNSNTSPAIRSYKLTTFNIDIVQSTGLAFIQSIALCILLRKQHDRPWLNSPLALVRDIASYRENRRLSEILHKRISRVWKTELAGGMRLNYFVGVDRTGSVIACEPMTPSSTENIQLTPLPSLFIPAVTVDPGVENLPPLAKFNVIFTAPGSLRVLPYRGVPLGWVN